jgi:hypothetical protein
MPLRIPPRWCSTSSTSCKVALRSRERLSTELTSNRAASWDSSSSWRGSARGLAQASSASAIKVVLRVSFFHRGGAQRETHPAALSDVRVDLDTAAVLVDDLLAQD